MIAGENPNIHPSAVIDPSVRLGDDCIIGANSVLSSGVILGDRVRIGALCFVAPDISIGDDCTLGHGVVITDDPRPASLRARTSPTRITDRVTIGSGSILYPGIRIGHDCIIAPASVVTCDLLESTFTYEERTRKTMDSFSNVSRRNPSDGELRVTNPSEQTVLP